MRLPLAIVLLAALAGSVQAQEPGDSAKGRAYAREHCAMCHGIEADDLMSPRPGLATFETIANTPGMTGTAIAVWLRTPHDKMPDFIIPTEDRNNLIAYIVSLRREPAREPAR